MVNCPICLSNIENSNVNTPCGHNFCYNCFVTHFTSGNSYSRNCPVCRSELCNESRQLIPINQQTIQSPPMITFLDLPLAYFDMNTLNRYNYSVASTQPTPIPSAPIPESIPSTPSTPSTPTQPTASTPTNYGYRYNGIFYNTLQHMNAVDQWTINFLRDWVHQDNESGTDQDTETDQDSDTEQDTEQDTDQETDQDSDTEQDYDLLI